MASRGKGARLKGANFERELAKKLTEYFSIEFKRGLGQTRKGGEEISDVYSEEVPEIHIEAKRQKRCNIKAALSQAKSDIKDTNKMPIIITKDDQQEIIVSMVIDDWMQIFKCYLELKKQNGEINENKE